MKAPNRPVVLTLRIHDHIGPALRAAIADLRFLPADDHALAERRLMAALAYAEAFAAFLADAVLLAGMLVLAIPAAGAMLGLGAVVVALALGATVVGLGVLDGPVGVALACGVVACIASALLAAIVLAVPAAAGCWLLRVANGAAEDEGGISADPRCRYIRQLADALDAYDHVAVWLDQLRVRDAYGTLPPDQSRRVAEATKRVMDRRDLLLMRAAMDEEVLANHPLGLLPDHRPDPCTDLFDAFEAVESGLRTVDGRGLAALEVA